MIARGRRDNQDVAATIKRQLQLLLPRVSIFLDVDDLESIDALETYVQASQALLVLLGSTKYFGSANCLRELAEARRLSLPLVRVHDADTAKKGGPLSSLRAMATRRLERRDTEHLFDDAAVIPWPRTYDYQVVSLAAMGEQLLRASPAYASDDQPVALEAKGAMAWSQPTFAQPVAVYASPSNPAAADAVRAVTELAASETVSVVRSLDEATHWLLFVSPECFDGEQGRQLAAEVQAALAARRPPVLVWSPESCEDFKLIMEATPQALKDARLYGALAIEWREGALQRTSVRLVAKALGARSERGSGSCAAARRCAKSVAAVCRPGAAAQGAGAEPDGARRSRGGRMIVGRMELPRRLGAESGVAEGEHERARMNSRPTRAPSTGDTNMERFDAARRSLGGGARSRMGSMAIEEIAHEAL